MTHRVRAKRAYQMRPTTPHAGQAKLCSCHEPAQGHVWGCDHHLTCINKYVNGSQCPVTYSLQQRRPTQCLGRSRNTRKEPS